MNIYTLGNIEAIVPRRDRNTVEKLDALESSWDARDEIESNDLHWNDHAFVCKEFDEMDESALTRDYVCA